MAEIELTLRHAGDEYMAIVDATFVKVDDSFDHAFGTCKRISWEPEDYETIAVFNSDGEELDEFAIPGLTRAIRDALYAYDYHP